VDDQKQTVEEL